MFSNWIFNCPVQHGHINGHDEYHLLPFLDLLLCHIALSSGKASYYFIYGFLSSRPIAPFLSFRMMFLSLCFSVLIFPPPTCSFFYSSSSCAVLFPKLWSFALSECFAFKVTFETARKFRLGEFCFYFYYYFNFDFRQIYIGCFFSSSCSSPCFTLEATFETKQRAALF